MRPSLVRAVALPERTSCHVLDAKYEAGAYCRVLYQLGERLVTGVLSFDDTDHAADHGVQVHPGMRAFMFPDDPKLPGLRAAMDPREVTRLLGRGARTRTRLTLLRYRPGKRATIRIDLRSDRGPLVLIGKVYSDHRKAAAVYNEGHACDASVADVGHVCVARPEGFVPELGMVAWQPVAGGELEPYLDTAVRVARTCARARRSPRSMPFPPVASGSDPSPLSSSGSTGGPRMSHAWRRTRANL